MARAKRKSLRPQSSAAALEITQARSRGDYKGTLPWRLQGHALRDTSTSSGMQAWHHGWTAQGAGEVFSGTGTILSVTRNALKIDTVCLDVDPERNQHICLDVLEVSTLRLHALSRALATANITLLLWMSVPCEDLSHAKTTGIHDLDKADSLVDKAFEFIDILKSERWFIENPETRLLKERPEF